jgi:hypothetical protein
MFRRLPVFASVVLGVFVATSHADLRTPQWWDQNAVATAPDWHYRVPISIPAGAAVNSTIRVNVDFAALLTQLGVAGTFDANSPRVVRGTGALVTIQEFTDSVYSSATDAAGNGRGEVRFILQDAGAVTYYLYFDIAANGAKPVNPQTPINGGFESGAVGAEDPPGWSGARTNATFDAQVRPSENPSVTTDGGGATPDPVASDGTPFTGSQSYLIGARSSNEAASGDARVTLTRTFAAPSSCPGGVSLRYRPEGWDSAWAGSTQYDFIRIRLVSGATSVVLVGPTASGASGNYAALPYSPNFSSDPPPPNNSGAADDNDSGFGPYNGFDTNNTGGHELTGMTVARGAQPWFNATSSLSSFAAGSTVTLEITSSHTVSYRSWFHIDHVEWCVVTAALGVPEGFGVNVSAPGAATTYTLGQRLTIRAQVDALPTAATVPVTANLYDNGGSLAASGIRLFNDGTHGDAVAGDATWTNDGSVGADPTYVFVGGVASGPNWSVRVFARDASTSSIGSTNGLVHQPGRPDSPETQANFFNIDEQAFSVQAPWLSHLKTTQVMSDPVNGSVNPKSIPGAMQWYTLRITNQGTGSVDANSLAITDAIPANASMYVGDVSGPNSGPIAFVESASGLSYTFTSLSSATDNLDFSTNGTSWTYVPTANANGVDPAVRYIRVRPQGPMAASGGSGNPSFEIWFRVRVN